LPEKENAPKKRGVTGGVTGGVTPHGVPPKKADRYLPSNEPAASVAQKLLYILTLAHQHKEGPKNVKRLAQLLQKPQGTIKTTLNRLKKRNKVVATVLSGRPTDWSLKSGKTPETAPLKKSPWPLPKRFREPGEPLYLHCLCWYHPEIVKHQPIHGIKSAWNYANFAPGVSLKWKPAKNGSLDIRVECSDKGLNAERLNQLIHFIDITLGLPAKSFLVDENWRWFQVGFRNIRGDTWDSSHSPKVKGFGQIRVSYGADWFCQLYEKKFQDGTKSLVEDWHYTQKPSLAPTIPQGLEVIKEFNYSVTGGIDTFQMLQEVKTWGAEIGGLKTALHSQHQEHLTVISELAEERQSNRALVEELRQERLMIVEKLDKVGNAISDLASYLARENRLNDASGNE